MENDASAVMKTIAALLARQLTERGPVEVVFAGDAPLTVELTLASGIGADGFLIEDRPGGGVRIAGDGERGVLYGVGKFLRTSRGDQGNVTAGTWRGTSVPEKPVRGIYLATHFHNFYHDAPVEEVQHYVEDLGLWGFNVLAVWNDMHHFNGFDDPEAVAYRTRLHAICSAARRIGLDVAFFALANEAYNNSPTALRADPSARRGGWYDCTVCPSVPGGKAYILNLIGQLFDWAADLHPRYLAIWPYDQGGCGCAACQPWGNNGFLKLAESVADLARRKLADCRLILSTWFFNEAERQGLDQAFAAEKPFVDYILAEGTKRPTPGGLPMVGFPEISMHETFPWGGFGATPLTGRAQRQWDDVKHLSAGGFPYSEGIYEDLTKAVYSQFYWSGRPAVETVREYIAFEFAPAAVEPVLQVVETLERNHHMRWWPGKLDGVVLPLNWFPSRNAAPREDAGAEAAYATLQRVDAQLTPQARHSWRWRQLYLRALLDAELKLNGGKPNATCNRTFAELITLYHAQRAEPCVRPPL